MSKKDNWTDFVAKGIVTIVVITVLAFIYLITMSNKANAAPTGIIKQVTTDCISSTHLRMKKFHIGIPGGHNSMLICSSGGVTADEEMATMEIGSVDLKFELTKQDGKEIMEFLDINLKGATYNLVLSYENFTRHVRNLVLYRLKSRVTGDRFAIMLLFVKVNSTES